MKKNAQQKIMPRSFKEKVLKKTTPSLLPHFSAKLP